MTTTDVNKRDWMELEHKYYQSTFKRQPMALVRGEGVRVWDTDGKVYLDFVAGIAVNVLGHCHPAIVKAVQEQVTQLVHVSNLYYNVRQIELAELLGQLSGGMRSFFSNSGAEANEGAIKLARKFGRVHRDGAYEVISMERSFHGRTLATTAATGQASYQATWIPLPDGFKQVPYNDLKALKAAVSENTVAVLLEVIQGEGGIWPGDKDSVCDRLCVPVEAKVELTLPPAGGADNADLDAAEARVPKPVTAAAAGLSAKRASDDKVKPLVFVDLAAPTGAHIELFVEGPTAEWTLPIPKPAPGAPAGHAYFGFELDGLPPGVDPKAPFELTFTIVQGDRATEVKTHLD